MHKPKRFEGELKEGMKVNIYRKEDDFWELQHTGIIRSIVINTFGDSYAFFKELKPYNKNYTLFKEKEKKYFEPIIYLEIPTLIEVISFKVSNWKERISPSSPKSEEVASSLRSPLNYIT